MISLEQLRAYFERVIAEDRLSGNRVGLKHAQIAAGYIMAAANAVGDKETALTFRVLASEAANKHEELFGAD